MAVSAVSLLQGCFLLAAGCLLSPSASAEISVIVNEFGDLPIDRLVPLLPGHSTLPITACTNPIQDE